MLPIHVYVNGHKLAHQLSSALKFNVIEPWPMKFFNEVGLSSHWGNNVYIYSCFIPAGDIIEAAEKNRCCWLAVNMRTVPDVIKNSLIYNFVYCTCLCVSPAGSSRLCLQTHAIFCAFCFLELFVLVALPCSKRSKIWFLNGTVNGQSHRDIK